MTHKGKLAINGGPRALRTDPGNIFDWPVITAEDEDAVLEVLRQGAMSRMDVTRRFERELAAWFGGGYALCHNNGTAAIQAALWACGVRRGDEVICQSMTYWGSVLQVFSLGGTVVFAEMNPRTLTLDPGDIEQRISGRTRAIVAVHYCGYPADMDPIMETAAKYGLKVIEDASHAHGGRYKGRLVGTIGHAGAMSMMSGKSLACGEGGLLLTRDAAIYQRALAFGHYERGGELDCAELKSLAGVPLGGCKFRMHQLSSALGRVQLRHYDGRMAEIQRAMHYYWDLLEGVPGLRPHRPPRDSGSTMGGWYAARGLYVAEELGGLPLSRFCAAVNAECALGPWKVKPGANPLMHLHPVLNETDVYGHGRPTRIARADRDLRQPPGSLPVTESLPQRCFSIPWFKHYRPRVIREYAAAFRKVAAGAGELI